MRKYHILDELLNSGDKIRKRIVSDVLIVSIVLELFGGLRG